MILDILKYFAKYPTRAAVIAAFSNGRSDFSTYATLMAYINNMSDHSRLPDVKGFVFGENYDAVKAHIHQLTEIYLYVDYGELNSSRDAKNAIHDVFKMGATIAMKIPNNYDQIECALASEQCLTIIRDMVRLILADQKEIPWLKEIGTDYTIVPFDAKEFSSYGWTLLFERKGADMLNIKNLD
jgi:hypothetical protein